MRKWLRRARESKGLTMKAMGDKLGVSESYYCGIENGTRQKKMDIALASALAISLDIPIAEVIENERSTEGAVDEICG